MSSLAVFRSIFDGHAWSIVAALTFILVLTLLANVLQQTLLKNSSDPPLVFHWVPVIGSTITYGIDPFKFIFQCQAKVRICDPESVIEKPSM